MTAPRSTRNHALCDLPMDRMAALSAVIDWAEGEAAALNAVETGICLQLARLALMTRQSQA